MFRLKQRYAWVIAGALLFAISSCSKEEGSGGMSEILGKVWVKNYNADFSILNDSYWAEEEDVYLIYGSDSIYSERFKTNYDGSYRFEYLQQGTYTVYVYSKDRTLESASGRVIKSETVTISKNGNTVVVPTITIFD